MFMATLAGAHRSEAQRTARCPTSPSPIVVGCFAAVTPRAAPCPRHEQGARRPRHLPATRRQLQDFLSQARMATHVAVIRRGRSSRSCGRARVRPPPRPGPVRGFERHKIRSSRREQRPLRRAEGARCPTPGLHIRGSQTAPSRWRPSGRPHRRPVARMTPQGTQSRSRRASTD